jgi:predicted thioesterase
MSDEDGPFDTAVKNAVVEHMNADHADDCAAICRARLAAPIVGARLTGYDARALTFSVEDERGERSALDVPWLRPVVERADLRAQLAEMALEARRPGTPAR